MKGLVFTKLSTLELREVEKPEIINNTDAIVRITLTSICGSDIHLVEGHIPTTPGFVLGHEYVGVVEQVGKSVERVKVGQRVCGPAAPYCGQCSNCKAGHIAHCLRGGIHGSGKELGNLCGTHCMYIRVPFADNVLINIPDNVEDEKALFVGDVLSSGYYASQKGKIRHGDSVVIFGAGPIGLAAVHTARLFHPGMIILVGNVNPYGLEIGKQLGADYTILSSQENALEKIMELTEGKGADVVIEAAGTEAALQNSVRCAGIGRRIVSLGVYGKKVSMPMNEICLKNISIHIGLAHLGNMHRLMNMLEIGVIDLTPIITHRMKLDNIIEGYNLFKSKNDNVIKIVIQP